MNIIYAPISLGEGFDKLSILDIKLNRIKDIRNIEVKKEYDILYSNINKNISEHIYLYNCLKKVNMLIWDLMDIVINNNPTGEEHYKIGKKLDEYNYFRFKLKDNINKNCNSHLKEQKSYNTTYCLIEINENIENIECFIQPIKYYSILYDNIHIIYNKNNNILASVFKNVESISFTKKENINYKFIYKFYENNYNSDNINKIFDITEEKLNIIN
jgi:hypothetical protein